MHQSTISNQIKKVLYACFLLLGAIFFASNSQAQQRLYFSSQDANAKGIYRANVDGTSITPIVPFGVSDSGTFIAVDDIGQKIYWADTSLYQINRADLDGTDIQNILSPAGVKNLAVDPVNQKVYWLDASGLARSNLDGTSIETVYVPTGGNQVTEFSIDVDNHLIGFAMSYMGGSPRTIYKADLTSGLPIISPITVATDINQAGFIADSNSSAFFWFDASSVHVFRTVGYSGSSATTVPVTLTGTGLIFGTAIDYPAANLYYADPSANVINKINIVGATVSKVADVNNPQSVALDCGEHAPDADMDGVPDQSGLLNCLDACPTDITKVAAGSCGCGVPDIDTDADGTLDCLEACPSDPLKTVAGTCGCGVTEDDSDYDGTLDCNDQCPTDARKTEPGKCGCGKIDDINDDGEKVCVKNREVRPNTKIEAPPATTVDGDDVTLIFEKFADANLEKYLKGSSKKQRAMIMKLAAHAAKSKSKYTIKYSAVITPDGGSKKDVKRTNSKRNQLTYKDLAPGNYTAKYRVVVTKKSTGKVEFRTKFSPTSSFTIS